jgi:intermediate cleaving peptidase 55
MATCRALVRQCAFHMRYRPLSHLRQLPRPRCNPLRSYASSVAAAELKFGQPLHETHPHILSPGERESLQFVHNGDRANSSTFV